MKQSEEKASQPAGLAAGSRRSPYDWQGVLVRSFLRLESLRVEGEKAETASLSAAETFARQGADWAMKEANNLMARVDASKEKAWGALKEIDLGQPVLPAAARRGGNHDLKTLADLIAAKSEALVSTA